MTDIEGLEEFAEPADFSYVADVFAVATFTRDGEQRQVHVTVSVSGDVTCDPQDATEACAADAARRVREGDRFDRLLPGGEHGPDGLTPHPEFAGLSASEIAWHADDDDVMVHDTNLA